VKRPPGPEAAWERRLEEIAAGAALEQGSAEKLVALLRLVRDDPRAATSVRTPAQAVDVHIADSLSALPFLDGAVTGGRAADIGSGAGFPGLPLAIARPGLHVDLLEATKRKCDFLEAAAHDLELGNVEVVHARAEDWGGGAGRGRYGAVLARAVAPLATLVEYAAPLLAMGGMLLAWKGERDGHEERQAGIAAAQLGLRAQGVERVNPYPGSRAHHLHLYEKVRLTPPGFPRRAGMARKQPLGR
jgi:16S rRNA (guanine527-N7)-methyltransferase